MLQHTIAYNVIQIDFRDKGVSHVIIFCVDAKDAFDGVKWPREKVGALPDQHISLS